MKKQFVFVLTLSSLLMSSCDQGDPQPFVAKSFSTPPPKISSFYPKSAPRGSTVAIFGENFGIAISDNYVTFDTVQAEVTQVQTGVIVVKVPMQLLEGNYVINLSANGQDATSPSVFTVTNDIN